tara:strand:- start:48 stop:2600 length:2553 start_codon:yes stop_codon:yes gene_type:complete
MTAQSVASPQIPAVHTVSLECKLCSRSFNYICRQSDSQKDYQTCCEECLQVLIDSKKDDFDRRRHQSQPGNLAIISNLKNNVFPVQRGKIIQDLLKRIPQDDALRGYLNRVSQAAISANYSESVAQKYFVFDFRSDFTSFSSPVESVQRLIDLGLSFSDRPWLTGHQIGIPNIIPYVYLIGDIIKIIPVNADDKNNIYNLVVKLVFLLFDHILKQEWFDKELFSSSLYLILNTALDSLVKSNHFYSASLIFNYFYKVRMLNYSHDSHYNKERETNTYPDKMQTEPVYDFHGLNYGSAYIATVILIMRSMSDMGIVGKIIFIVGKHGNGSVKNGVEAALSALKVDASPDPNNSGRIVVAISNLIHNGCFLKRLHESVISDYAMREFESFSKGTESLYGEEFRAILDSVASTYFNMYKTQAKNYMRESEVLLARWDHRNREAIQERELQHESERTAINNQYMEGGKKIARERCQEFSDFSRQHTLFLEDFNKKAKILRQRELDQANLRNQFERNEDAIRQGIINDQYRSVINFESRSSFILNTYNEEKQRQEIISRRLHSLHDRVMNFFRGLLLLQSGLEGIKRKEIEAEEAEAATQLNYTPELSSFLALRKYEAAWRNSAETRKKNVEALQESFHSKLKKEIWDACDKRDLDTLRKYRGYNATVIQYTENRFTPLMIACQDEDLGIIEELRVHFPLMDPNARNALGQTALIGACFAGKVEVVKELKKYPSIDPNIIDIDSNWAALYAFEMSNLEILEVLKGFNNIDPNIKDYNGFTLLMNACSVTDKSYKIELVKKLLEFPRIEIDCKDYLGRSAEYFAQRNKTHKTELLNYISSARQEAANLSGAATQGN